MSVSTSPLTTFQQDLSCNLRAAQPIIWITNDEPARCASYVRNVIVETFKNSKISESVSLHGYQLFEHDILAGMMKIWDSRNGEVINTSPAIGGQTSSKGTPVDFFNKAPAGASPMTPSAQTGPKNNFSPGAPWHFFTDMMSEVPNYSIVLCHNLSEVINSAKRIGLPHATALMRHALLLMTGNISSSSKIAPFNGSARILVATGKLPDSDLIGQEILDTFSIIRFDRPSVEDICEKISSVTSAMSPERRNVFEAETMANYGTDDIAQATYRASNSLRGLTLFAAESAASRTLTAKKCLSPQMLARERRDIIERSPALKLHEPSDDFRWERVKGVDRFEKFVKAAMHTTDPKLRLNAMTFVGPQGTGKSMAAKALSTYLGWPLVLFNIGSVMNKYQGSSQENMRQALSIIDALGDVVLLIDEADKQLAGMISDGGSTGDNGTASQVMQLLLSWEQDRAQNKARALVIKTANRIRNLKAESQRAGRNDATFFFDFPSYASRRDILALYAKDSNLEIPEKLFETIVADTQYWSGAELAELVKNLGRFKGEYQEAKRFVKPVYYMDPDDIKKIRDEGRKVGESASSINIDDEGQHTTQSIAASSNGSRMMMVA